MTRFRKIQLLFVATLLFASTTQASAQEWAKKMFKVASHDFGTVARGSKQEFSFELKNLYKETVHIAGVRSSCGCTTPKVGKDTLKTFETGSITATYNTRSFLGSKSATLTVTIDKPFYAEVQLQIKGYIRRDVVFTPGEINFGSVEAGKGATAKVGIAYAGRSDWKIVDVRSANSHLEVELTETKRGGGRVDYQMLVQLNAAAPAGYIQDQLTIVTNDTSKSSKVTLPVSGRVVSELTLSPQSLVLGVVKPGETVTKRLLVRGKKPFRVLDVKCDDCFEVAKPEADKKLHFVSIKFTAGDKAAKVAEKIQIKTTAGVVECLATATIKP